MLSKKVILPILAVAIAGSALFGANQVAHAQGAVNSTLVQMIAQKFGLDQTAVQSVFDQYKSTRQATAQQNMQQRLDSKLTQEVQQGKITDAQKQAILAELSALKSKYNPSSFKGMTVAQRKQAFQNEQSDLKSWASSQGIDLSLIPGFGGMGMHRGVWSK